MFTFFSSHLAISLAFLLVTTLSCKTGSSQVSGITAIWAASDRDKVAKEELRNSTSSTVWKDGKVILHGAKNETVAFSLIVEAAGSGANGIFVSFDTLTGPSGYAIRTATGPSYPFQYVGRDIELFYLRYLKIQGLSVLSYETYDERHIPSKFRRSFNAFGRAVGNWSSRPHADMSYPDIAVPLESVGSFKIGAHTNQGIWTDIYIPKNAPAGIYTGQMTVLEGQKKKRQITVELTVHDFSLPDTPTLKTMVYLSSGNVAKRYLGKEAGTTPDEYVYLEKIRNRHFQLAHRHKISLIGDGGDRPFNKPRPRPEWEKRLSGELFTAAHGYSGPGQGVPNDVYSIGTYGSWNWSKTDKKAFQENVYAWGNWFQTHSPQTDVFLYLIDESNDYPSIERWASWMDATTSPGNRVYSMATTSIAKTRQLAPSLDWPCNVTTVLAEPAKFESLAESYRVKEDKKLCIYNGRRPFTGSFAIEDDGTALQALAWAQFKKRIDRWFYWESTYYNNYQGGAGETNVFQTAQTFGASPRKDAAKGMTSWMYGNGDGVLFYPGTDKMFPDDSYGLDGPIASLRLKYWRRGLQDAEYLNLASKVQPEQVKRMIEDMIPKVLWEYGFSDPSDPTWVRTDISWPSEPAHWHVSRAKLAQIIARR